MANIVQNTYTDVIPNGYPGMVANGEAWNKISRTIEDAAGIAFGKAAFAGAGDHGCVVTPAAGKFMGVAIVDHGIQVKPGGVAADIYPQYANVPLMDRGVVWVIVSANVADQDAAFVTPAGLFTNTDNSAANPAIPGHYLDTVTSGGLARLKLTK